MKIIVYSAKPYDRVFLEESNASYGHELQFIEARLSPQTCELARGTEAVCIFVNDVLNEAVLQSLSRCGVKYLLLRCAGYNHVDRNACRALGMKAAYVPRYSPYAVAEHTVALILALNRKTHRAYARVRENNFSIDGLLGFDLNGRRVGLIGAGRIGAITAKIMAGFGCEIVAYDPAPSEPLPSYVQLKSFEEVIRGSDILSLHCPLNPNTRHLLNGKTLQLCRRGIMIVNTSRGGLIDTTAMIDALKAGQVGYLGIDVYEEEAEYFYEDLSEKIIDDDNLSRLISFPNVLITAHQAFFTREALTTIARTTLESARAFENRQEPSNALRL
ncbi:MAG TPA: 2-hydroxyacid dehydrogenase [Opitutaceae bacterium]